MSCSFEKDKDGNIVCPECGYKIGDEVVVKCPRCAYLFLKKCSECDGCSFG